jgi:phosphate transport system substrate-binding protein
MRMLNSAAIAAAWLWASAALAQDAMTGRVKVDGSSTVAPILNVAKEMFFKVQPKIEITVGISGTGGGFKKFHEAKPDLRTDISNASRPIETKEIDACGKLGIEFIELPVALDGLAIVVNPANTFCDHLTVAELKKIWEPGSKINNWKDVREGFPDLPLKLFGPGTDSGTFDYFTAVIVGKEKACRSDFSPSESDNTLVVGVSGEKGAMGYFGVSYYENNAKKLKLVGVDNGNGKPVKPTMATVLDGTYAPLSRPLFIYVNKESAGRPQVSAFIEYLLANAKSIVEHPKAGYIALSPEFYEVGKKRFRERILGSVCSGHAADSKPLAELFGVSKKQD